MVQYYEIQNAGSIGLCSSISIRPKPKEALSFAGVSDPTEYMLHTCSVRKWRKILVRWRGLYENEQMKLTVNLDQEILDKVVEITGSTTKTEAIMFALKEVERRARLVEVLREGLGASESELKSMFDPNSAPDSIGKKYTTPNADSLPLVAEGD